uniref:G-protein coupled receptors family 3 profile domain-containing protein n=1 Tax=Knipowitschia caucasica TaxID=637954 RepID=A0AAV2KQQ3_KNICA
MNSLAAIHAIEEVNAAGFLPGVSLGYMMCDTCSHPSKALQNVELMLSYNQSLHTQCDYTQYRPEVKAILGARYSETSVSVAKLLSVSMVPLLSSSSSSPALSDKQRYPSFLRTIPSDVHQTMALTQLMAHFSWNWVGVVYRDDDYGKAALQSFLRDAQRANVCVAYQEELPFQFDPQDNGHDLKRVAEQIRSSTAQVVLLILTPVQVEAIFKEMIKTNTKKIWLASDSWTVNGPLAHMDGINQVGDILGFMFIARKSESFDNYLKNLSAPVGGYNQFIEEYKNLRFHCSPECNSDNPPSFCKMKSTEACKASDPQAQNDEYLVQTLDTGAAFLERAAVWAVAHSLRKVLRCNRTVCSGRKDFFPWELLVELRRIHFDYENHTFYFDENGDSLNGYDLIMWTKDGNRRQFSKIGRYRALDKMIKLDQKDLIWLSTSNSTVPVCRCSERCKPGYFKKILSVSCCYTCVPCDEGSFTDGWGNCHCSVSDRSVSDRSVSDRSDSDRSVSDRSVSDRSDSDRSVSDRSDSDRSVSDRSDSDRSDSDHSVSDRSDSDRSVSDRSDSDRSVSDRSDSDHTLVTAAIVTAAIVTTVLVTTAIVTTVIVTTVLVTAAIVTAAIVTTVLVTTAIVTTALVTAAIVTAAIVTTVLVTTAIVTTVLVTTALVTTAIVTTAIVTSVSDRSVSDRSDSDRSDTIVTTAIVTSVSDRSDSDHSVSDHSDSDHSVSDRSDSDHSDSIRSVSDRSDSDHNVSDRSDSDHNVSDRSDSDRSDSDRSDSGRSDSDRSVSDRSINHEDCKLCPTDTWCLKGQDHCVPRWEFFLRWNEALPITILVATLLGFLLLLIVLILFWVYRNSSAMKRAEVAISTVMIAGLSVSFASVICFMGKPNIHLCRARQVMYALGFTMCVSCVLVKAYRTFLAFLPFGRVLHRRLKKFYQPAAIIVVLTILQGVICCLWLIFDSPDIDQTPPSPLNLKKVIQCHEGPKYIGFGIMLSYVALLALVGFLLAFKGRKVPQQFSETGYIIFSMLMYLFVWVCFVPVYITNKEERTAVQASAILVSNYGIIFCHFLPKCYEAIWGSDTDTMDRFFNRMKAMARRTINNGSPGSENHIHVPSIRTIEENAKSSSSPVEDVSPTQSNKSLEQLRPDDTNTVSNRKCHYSMKYNPPRVPRLRLRSNSH